MKPESGKIYTLHQILTQLTLKDKPCLTFFHCGASCVIQDNHATDLLALPKWSESTWRFIRTTHESVPVFQFWLTPELPITDLVDIEDDKYYHDSYWVTPKGMPCEQTNS